MKFTLKISMVVFLTGLLVTIGQAQMPPWGDDTWGHQERHNMDWPDSAQVITLMGVAMVDASFPFHLMPHYYLDIEADGEADYLLGFGPWWYEPTSGATRPNDGENITISGWLFTQTDHPNDSLPDVAMVVVQEINSLAWRSTDGTPPWSGNWIHRNADGDQFVYCPTDSGSWLRFRRGSMMGGGMMFPDSMWVEFELMHPDSLPGLVDSLCFAGFHANMVDDRFGDMLGHRRHRVGFQQNIHQRFHFSQAMLNERGIGNFNNVELRYYSETGDWMRASTAQYNAEENLLDYESPAVSSYYGLFAVSTGTGVSGESARPLQFGIVSNYPNPFNPVTTIQFSTSTNDLVVLTIYNVLGHKVRELVNGRMSAGLHEAEWDGRNENGAAVNSGIFIVELRAGDMRRQHKITLLK